MNSIIETLVQIGVIGGTLIFSIIKIVPGVIAKALEQQRDYDFKKALQVDSFYRQSGSSILQELMNDWIKLATDMNYVEKVDEKFITELTQKTIGYASSRTIKIAAAYFQLTYISNAVDEKGETDSLLQSSTNQKGIVYFAAIVASLKKDFTGEEISPTDILRLKITDYEIQKDFFEQTILEIEQSVRSKD
ncbi:hypothetical protein [Leuconostoc suionicum]|uniref:hypothetical protein n=1 Tax=Leuconostoc suionicum TaxID=1511761 RepID=UPI00233F4F63|nr:hypothetical protein [Leuconostoc suionicum]MDC2804816.1 hypothetical protein [Leuconostoc suionicum]MDC2822328.1 hypothetical protein [Leuconostoc suionicum]